MALMIASLLIHNSEVPEAAREALRAATLLPAEQRWPKLESAARILYRETELDCSEARDLVGLPPHETCECSVP